jgi:Cu+-exporting ATPase
MMATKTDPVCKMDVDTKTADATSQHEGQTYYFCCSECKEKFDKEPEHYVGGKKTPANK